MDAFVIGASAAIIIWTLIVGALFTFQ